MIGDVIHIYSLAAGLCSIPVIIIVLYLLGLMLAAAMALRWPRAADTISAQELAAPDHLRTIVMIPAHNEEEVLEATLDSVQAQKYAADLFEIVVIADNCTDRTAEIARSRGVTVLERFNKDERGKGYALAWAVDQLLSRSVQADCFIVVDADTWVAEDFTRVMTRHLEKRQDARGCCALQGRYGVLNGGDSWRASLMDAAFELYNHVRPLGCSWLGLTISLKGNGMGFTRKVFETAPWRGNSVTEDVDYGLDLVHLFNIHVGYVPSARVRAQMPVTATQAASQRERWEGGRYRLLKDRARPLILDSFRRRSLMLLEAGFSLMVPPLSEVAVFVVLWTIVIALGVKYHLLLHASGWIALCTFILAAFVTYVFGGMAVAGAPRSAYSSLLKAPFYIVWKFALYIVRFLKPGKGKKQQEWVRTERVAVPTASASRTDETPAEAPKK